MSKTIKRLAQGFTVIAALYPTISLIYAAAYISPVHILAINARDVGFDIYVEGNQNPDGCSQTGIMRVTSTTSNRSDLIATALTAFSLGKPVRAYLNGCDGDGVPIAFSILVNS